MNLQIAPRLNLISFNKLGKSDNVNNGTNDFQMPKYANALNKDTVSFRGVIPRKTYTISEHVMSDFESLEPRLKRIATTYMDILEAVSGRLKDVGISFDRDYSEAHAVKSPKSYTSKIKRSGSFKVPDVIRATLYCEDPYDLSIINKLLPEMEKRGYVLADTEETMEHLIKRGYIPTAEEIKSGKADKVVPDLDIRLKDVSSQLPVLPEALKFSIGKPQKSGYEDIQMRFVRAWVDNKKKTPVLHELIVLFGPNYAQAKHDESEYVYNFLRNFKELKVDLSDTTVGSHSQKASRYIDLIEQMFRGKVSDKLFMNAKNKDLYKIDDEVPIHFTTDDYKIFEGYFSGLNDRITSVYAQARKNPELTPVDKRELAKNMKDDKAMLRTIREGLKATIAHYSPEVIPPEVASI